MGASVTVIYKIVLSRLKKLSVMAVSLASKIRLVLLDLNGLTYRDVVKGLPFSPLEIVIERWMIRLLFRGLKLQLGVGVDRLGAVFGVVAANLVEFAFGSQSGWVHFLREMLVQMLAAN